MDAWDLPWCRLTLTLFLFQTGQRSIWLWSGFPHRPGYRKRMCTGCSHITIPGHEMENRNGSTLTRSVSWQPGIIHLYCLSAQHTSRIPSLLPSPLSSWAFSATAPSLFPCYPSEPHTWDKIWHFLAFKSKALTLTLIEPSSWLLLCTYFFTPCSLLLTKVHLSAVLISQAGAYHRVFGLRSGIFN